MKIEASEIDRICYCLSIKANYNPVYNIILSKILEGRAGKRFEVAHEGSYKVVESRDII